MADHKRRFERWRTKLPQNTAYLVDRVLGRMVPIFEDAGFGWYPDYAGGDSRQVGFNEIPLQQRGEGNWPTVHIRFDDRARPYFTVYFASLPLTCKRLTGKGSDDIPRNSATVVDGPAYFSLRKGKYSDYRDGHFGYSGLFGYLFSSSIGNILRYRLSARDFLDREIDEGVDLLPILFRLFNETDLEDWSDAPFGHVSKHVMLMGSWRLSHVN